MNCPISIIKKYYDPGSDLYRVLVVHSELVAQKALAVADGVKHLNPDCRFVFEAAMLHDVGIFLTHLPAIGCIGDKPYLCHGYLGRELLEKEGFVRHALVCDRHIGVGITLEDVVEYHLPLPKRNMVPVSLEEQIVCYADKFYSKDLAKLSVEKSPTEIKDRLLKFGPDKVAVFERWLKMFGG